MSAADSVDPFVHNVAIKLSRAQNTINPNDLLARSVIDIAKSQSKPAFVKGSGVFLSRLALPANLKPSRIYSCGDIWEVPTAIP